MKYIDAEKLIKSVNNYLEGAKAAFNPIDGYADYYKGKIDACENIQELIASLQQEQPEVELGKEIEKVWEAFPPKFLDYTAFAELVTHFYELGLNARKEE